jgi:uncharacterized protein YceK
MKKYIIALLIIALSSCSSLGTGKNGSPGENGSKGIGTENGKNGAPGKNGDR